MISKAFRRLLSLPAADRSLLLRSVTLVAAAKLALWVLPFNIARKVLSVGSRRRTGTPDETPERIGFAVSRASEITGGSCLSQAVAAESLLLRCGHPVDFRIGVVKTDDGRLEAHAWVESGGRLIVGDLPQGLSAYSPLPPLPRVSG